MAAPPPSKGKKGRQRRLALAAGAALAVVAYLVIRGRSGGGSDLIAASGPAPTSAIDPGAAAGTGIDLTGQLTSFTDLLEQRLAAMETTNQALADSITGQLAGVQEDVSGLQESVDWWASQPEEAADNELGASGQTPAASPGNAKVTRKVYGKDYGRGVYRDKQGRLTYKGPAKPAKPKAAGKDYGRGVYRDAKGRLTYKGPAKPKPKPKPKSPPRRTQPSQTRPSSKRRLGVTDY